MKYTIGLDIGTSGTTLVLTNQKGIIVYQDSSEYDYETIQPGWHEQNPDIWYQTTLQLVSRVPEKFNRKDIIAVSMAGQMHSLVMINAHGEVIRPAILWNDVRSKEQCDEITEILGGVESVVNLTGNVALEGFTLSKLLWVKQNEPTNYQRISKIMMPKDYVGYRLTGRIYTERSDASGTMIMNLETNEWNKLLMKKLNLNENILPEILSSTDIVNVIKPNIAEIMNLDSSTLIIAGGAYNACSALGNGMFRDGDSLMSIGTSGTVISLSQSFPEDLTGNYHYFTHVIDGLSYKMTVILSAGMSLKWLRDKMLSKKYSYDQLNEITDSGVIGSKGIVFHPYLSGERSPIRLSHPAGTFSNLSIDIGIQEIIRSVYEGVSYAFRDCLEVIDLKNNEIVITGGGSKSSVWVQMISDVSNMSIKTIKNPEGPAYGASLLAGLGVEMYTIEEIKSNGNFTTDKEFRPSIERHEEYTKSFSKYKYLSKILESIDCTDAN